MFMLDLLDQLPRLHLSDDQLKTIIWVMKECNTPNILNFSSLRRKQTLLAKALTLEPEQCTSALGNEFSFNDPAKFFPLVRLLDCVHCTVLSHKSQDFANPLVRPHMALLPKLQDPVTDFTQCGKWTREIDNAYMTPVWANWQSFSAPQFYVNELAQLHGANCYFVPKKWITLTQQVYAEGHSARYDNAVCVLLHMSVHHCRRSDPMPLNFRSIPCPLAGLSHATQDLHTRGSAPETLPVKATVSCHVNRHATSMPCQCHVGATSMSCQCPVTPDPVTLRPCQA
jgi:hypothetical protein